MNPDDPKPVLREMPEVEGLLDPLREQKPPAPPTKTDLHPRDAVMTAAGNELVVYFQGLCDKYGLSWTERLHVASVLIYSYTNMNCHLEREGQ